VPSSGHITELLQAATAGDAAAADRLFQDVYQELRVIARSHRKRWHGNYTMNTTALIHEAYIKLANHDAGEYQDRTHFYATASKAMRHILVNYAERRNAAKRGGTAVDLDLEEQVLVADENIDELLMVDSLLRGLEADNPRGCRVVECRIFGGMTIAETAKALDISPATVKREWTVASATMYRAMNSPAEKRTE